MDLLKPYLSPDQLERETNGGGDFVGIYLASLTGKREDFRGKLEKFWEWTRNQEVGKGLRIVSAFFPPNFPHPQFQAENFKKALEEAEKTSPWPTLPSKDVEKIIRLRKKFGVKDGESALVVLDGKTGQLISKNAHLYVSRDFRQFPWKAPHVWDILRSVPAYKSGKETSCKGPEELEKISVLGIYFSAFWCPPCKAFTTQLVKTYGTIKERDAGSFEIIFVSSDRSRESYEQYVSTMPWLAVPYEEEHCRTQLTHLYGIQGIPSLVILNADGTVITEDGRGEVSEDPQAQNFPWHAKAVNILTPRQAGKLHNFPAVVLFIDGDEDWEIEMAEAVLQPVHDRVRKKYPDSDLLFFIATDSDTSESLRDFVKLEESAPLLTIMDLPMGRAAVMEYGKDIVERSIMEFADKFHENTLQYFPV